MSQKKDHIDLEKLNKKAPFSTPDKYFDELPQNIMAKVEGQKSRSWIGSLIARPTFKIGLGLTTAAVAALIIFIGPEEQTESTVEVAELIDQIPVEKASDYVELEERIDEIEIIDLAVASENLDLSEYTQFASIQETEAIEGPGDKEKPKQQPKDTPVDPEKQLEKDLDNIDLDDIDLDDIDFEDLDDFV